MATVDFVGLTKRHDGPRGAVDVLRGIDLHVPEGAFVVLVGPSGCGKSTLLRCVAGLEEPTAGEVRIGGVRVNDVPPAARDVAMVFQGYALYPHMTVRENMGFALRLRKDPSADARVEEVARMLGLVDLLDRLPRQLSGGQRQRVAMGRAVVRRPRVFLFDEPLSNLDAALRTQVRSELRRLHAHLGVTTIYVTHDQVEAMTLADRIVVLQGGVVQQVGTPQEVYDSPANRFVAGFVGTPGMAFLAQVEPDTIVGVRPHAVVLGRGAHTGTVRFVERLGAEALVHLERAGEPLAARVDGAGLATLPSVGTEVVFELGSVHRFDPVTGERRG
jgi:ABC-type sugar transport system ATPase subunit